MDPPHKNSRYCKQNVKWIEFIHQEACNLNVSVNHCTIFHYRRIIPLNLKLITKLAWVLLISRFCQTGPYGRYIMEVANNFIIISLILKCLFLCWNFFFAIYYLWLHPVHLCSKPAPCVCYKSHQRRTAMPAGSKVSWHQTEASQLGSANRNTADSNNVWDEKPRNVQQLSWYHRKIPFFLQLIIVTDYFIVKHLVLKMMALIFVISLNS